MAKHMKVHMRVEKNERIYCDKCKQKVNGRAYLLVYPHGQVDAVYGDCCVNPKDWKGEENAG